MTVSTRRVVQYGGLGARRTTFTSSPEIGMSSMFSMRPKTCSSKFSIEVYARAPVTRTRAPRTSFDGRESSSAHGISTCMQLSSSPTRSCVVFWRRFMSRSSPSVVNIPPYHSELPNGMMFAKSSASVTSFGGGGPPGALPITERAFVEMRCFTLCSRSPVTVMRSPTAASGDSGRDTRQFTPESSCMK